MIIERFEKKEFLAFDSAGSTNSYERMIVSLDGVFHNHYSRNS